MFGVADTRRPGQTFAGVTCMVHAHPVESGEGESSKLILAREEDPPRGRHILYECIFARRTVANVRLVARTLTPLRELGVSLDGFPVTSSSLALSAGTSASRRNFDETHYGIVNSLRRTRERFARRRYVSLRSQTLSGELSTPRLRPNLTTAALRIRDLFAGGKRDNGINNRRVERAPLPILPNGYISRLSRVRSSAYEFRGANEGRGNYSRESNENPFTWRLAAISPTAASATFLGTHSHGSGTELRRIDRHFARHTYTYRTSK